VAEQRYTPLYRVVRTQDGPRMYVKVWDETAASC